MPASIPTALDVATSVDPDVLRDAYWDDDDAINFGRRAGETTGQKFGKIFFESSTGEFVIEATRNGVAAYDDISIRTNGSEAVKIDASHRVIAGVMRIENAALATAVYIEGTNGATAAVSAANEGRIRYNQATQKWEFSENAGAYFAPASATTAFVQDGNTFGALATLGTNDAFALAFETNAVERVRILTTGEVQVGPAPSGLAAVAELSVRADQNAYTEVTLQNATAGTGAASFFRAYADAAGALLGCTSSSWTPTLGINADEFVVWADNNCASLNVATRGTTPILFTTNSVERARILSGGEVLLGATALSVATYVEATRNQNAVTSMALVNTTSGTAARTIMFADAGTGASLVEGAVVSISAGFTTSGADVAGEVQFAGFGTGTTAAAIRTSQARPVKIYTADTERVRILSTGEPLFGATALLSTEYTLFQRNQNAETFGYFANTTSGTAAAVSWFLQSGSGGASVFGGMRAYSAGFTTSGQSVAGEFQYLAGDVGVTGVAVRVSTSDYLRFLTNDTERVRILSTGEFLAGTTAVTGAAEFAIFQRNANSATRVVARNTTDGTAAFTQFLSDQGSGGTNVFANMNAMSTTFTTSTIDVAGAAAFYGGGAGCTQVTYGSANASPALFYTNSVERMRILSTGPVVVGAAATVVGELFSVQKAQNAGTIIALSNTTSGTAAYSQIYMDAGGTSAVRGSIYALSAGYTTVGQDIAGEFQLAGFGASLTGLAIRTMTADPIRFVTNEAERMRILSGGAVLVAATTQVGTEIFRVTAGTSIFDFTSTTAFQVAQTAGGNVSLTVDTTNRRVGARVTPTSSLHSGGSLAAPPKRITNADSPYTALETDFTLEVDASGGAVTVNLPALAGVTGRVYNVKKIDASANAVTIDGSGAETIDGTATKATTTQYANYQIQAGTTEWVIL